MEMTHVKEYNGTTRLVLETKEASNTRVTFLQYFILLKSEQAIEYDDCPSLFGPHLKS